MPTPALGNSSLEESWGISTKLCPTLPWYSDRLVLCSASLSLLGPLCVEPELDLLSLPCLTTLCPHFLSLNFQFQPATSLKPHTCSCSELAHSKADTSRQARTWEAEPEPRISMKMLFASPDSKDVEGS